MVRSIFLFLILVAACVVISKPASAGDHVDAGIQVMAYGYELKLVVNGVDLGLTGGKTEARRIKDKKNPWKEKMAGQPAERLERIFVLEQGKNHLQLTYRKTGTGPYDKLEFELYLETESSEGRVSLIKDELTDSSGTISKDFEIPKGDFTQVKPMRLK